MRVSPVPSVGPLKVDPHRPSAEAEHGSWDRTTQWLLRLNWTRLRGVQIDSITRM